MALKNSQYQQVNKQIREHLQLGKLGIIDESKLRDESKSLDFYDEKYFPPNQTLNDIQWSVKYYYKQQISDYVPNKNDFGVSNTDILSKTYLGGNKGNIRLNGLKQYLNQMFSVEIFTKEPFLFTFKIASSEAFSIYLNDIQIYGTSKGTGNIDEIKVVEISAYKFIRIDLLYYNFSSDFSSGLGAGAFEFGGNLASKIFAYRDVIPDSPSNLTASSGVVNTIQLTWQNGIDLNQNGGTQIWYKNEKVKDSSEDQGLWYFLANVNYPTTIFQDINLTASTTRYYKVRHYTSTGDVSAFSNEVVGQAAAQVVASITSIISDKVAYKIGDTITLTVISNAPIQETSVGSGIPQMSVSIWSAGNELTRIGKNAEFIKQITDSELGQNGGYSDFRKTVWELDDLSGMLEGTVLVKVSGVVNSILGSYGSGSAEGESSLFVIDNTKPLCRIIISVEDDNIAQNLKEEDKYTYKTEVSIVVPYGNNNNLLGFDLNKAIPNTIIGETVGKVSGIEYIEISNSGIEGSFKRFPYIQGMPNTWDLAIGTVYSSSKYKNLSKYNPLPDDTYTVYARLIDYAGNVSDTSSDIIILDQTPCGQITLLIAESNLTGISLKWLNPYGDGNKDLSKCLIFIADETIHGGGTGWQNWFINNYNASTNLSLQTGLYNKIIPVSAISDYESSLRHQMQYNLGFGHEELITLGTKIVIGIATLDEAGNEGVPVFRGKVNKEVDVPIGLEPLDKDGPSSTWEYPISNPQPNNAGWFNMADVTSGIILRLIADDDPNDEYTLESKLDDNCFRFRVDYDKKNGGGSSTFFNPNDYPDFTVSNGAHSGSKYVDLTLSNYFFYVYFNSTTPWFEGTHIIEFFAIDQAGNPSEVKEITIKIDNSVPFGLAFVNAKCDTSDVDVTLYFGSVTDSISGVKQVNIYRDGTATANLLGSVPYYGQSFFIDDDESLIPAQSYTYYIEAVDNADNVSSTVSKVMTLMQNYEKVFKNYLNNSSFERNSGAGTFPTVICDGWVQNLGNAVLSNSGSYHGTFNVQCNSTNNVKSEDIWLDPDLDYTLSYYYYAPSFPVTLRVYIKFYSPEGIQIYDGTSGNWVDINGDGFYELVDTYIVGLSSMWYQRTFTFGKNQSGKTIPLNTTRAEIYLVTTTSAWVYFDQLQIEEGTSATKFVDSRVITTDRLNASVVKAHNLSAGCIRAEHITSATLQLTNYLNISTNIKTPVAHTSSGTTINVEDSTGFVAGNYVSIKSSTYEIQSVPDSTTIILTSSVSVSPDNNDYVILLSNSVKIDENGLQARDASGNLHTEIKPGEIIIRTNDTDTEINRFGITGYKSSDGVDPYNSLAGMMGSFSAYPWVRIDENGIYINQGALVVKTEDKDGNLNVTAINENGIDADCITSGYISTDRLTVGARYPGTWSIRKYNDERPDGSSKGSDNWVGFSDDLPTLQHIEYYYTGGTWGSGGIAGPYDNVIIHTNPYVNRGYEYAENVYFENGNIYYAGQSSENEKLSRGSITSFALKFKTGATAGDIQFNITNNTSNMRIMLLAENTNPPRNGGMRRGKWNFYPTSVPIDYTRAASDATGSVPYTGLSTNRQYLILVLMAHNLDKFGDIGFDLNIQVRVNGSSTWIDDIINYPDLQWISPDDNSTTIDGGYIETETIVADNIAAGAITAGKINVTGLGSISSNLGTEINAGKITFTDGSGIIEVGMNIGYSGTEKGLTVKYGSETFNRVKIDKDGINIRSGEISIQNGTSPINYIELGNTVGYANNVSGIAMWKSTEAFNRVALNENGLKVKDSNGYDLSISTNLGRIIAQASVIGIDLTEPGIRVGTDGLGGQRVLVGTTADIDYTAITKDNFQVIIDTGGINYPSFSGYLWRQLTGLIPPVASINNYDAVIQKVITDPYTASSPLWLYMGVDGSNNWNPLYKLNIGSDNKKFLIVNIDINVYTQFFKIVAWGNAYIRLNVIYTYLVLFLNNGVVQSFSGVDSNGTSVNYTFNDMTYYQFLSVTDPAFKYSVIKSHPA